MTVASLAMIKQVTPETRPMPAITPAQGTASSYNPVAANGEIYNHRALRKQFEGAYDFKTESDCEVILALYKAKGASFLDEMNGIFGFAIYDTEKDEYFIARDHMGIIPLYMG